MRLTVEEMLEIVSELDRLKGLVSDYSTGMRELRSERDDLREQLDAKVHDARRHISYLEEEILGLRREVERARGGAPEGDQVVAGQGDAPGGDDS